MNTLQSLIASKHVVLTNHAQARWEQRFRNSIIWEAIANAVIVRCAKLIANHKRAKMGSMYYYDSESRALFSVLRRDSDTYIITTVVKHKLV